MVTVRRAAAGDGTGIWAVNAAVTPQLIRTGPAFEGELRPEGGRVLLVAVDDTDDPDDTDDDRIVGWGNVYPPAPGAGRPKLRITVQVAPDHRRRGAGKALLAELVAVAEGLSASGLLIVVEDGEESRRFATSHGFTLTRRLQLARLDLDDAPAALDPPAGLRLASYAEVTPRQVWEAVVAVAGSDPSGLGTRPPFEQWQASDWEQPDLDHDLSFVLLDGDRVVAFTSTLADPARGQIWPNLTGTVPSHRGAGLSKVVKSQALVAARDAGLRTAYTGNDADNRPMVAVNRWLGYRAAGLSWIAEKELP